MERNKPYAVIALMLWNEYQDELPDAPGRMAQKILAALEEEGLYFSQVGDEVGQRHKRSPRKVWWILILRSSKLLFPHHVFKNVRRNY